jgi:hypothetical protein
MANLVIKYKLLAKHNPEDVTEPDRYDCSECDDDIFNREVHAKLVHEADFFEVDSEEFVRQHEPPFQPCGFLGCTFAPHDNNQHSWGLWNGTSKLY